MLWLVDVIKYGGPIVAILALNAFLIHGFINKTPENRNVFKLVLLFTVVVSVVVIAMFVRDFYHELSARAPNPPVKEVVPNRVGPKPGSLQRSTRSTLQVRGVVKPIPTQPAIISIAGMTGKWPIDTAGEFSFTIPGGPTDATIIVTKADGSTQSGFYVLSGEPLLISIK